MGIIEILDRSQDWSTYRPEDLAILAAERAGDPKPFTSLDYLDRMVHAVKHVALVMGPAAYKVLRHENDGKHFDVVTSASMLKLGIFGHWRNGVPIIVSRVPNQHHVLSLRASGAVVALILVPK